MEKNPPETIENSILITPSITEVKETPQTTITEVKYPAIVTSSRNPSAPVYVPSQLQEEERPQVISNTKIKKPVKMAIRK